MKKRILVVEDEEKLRRVIELQLLSSGFEVDKAASAEEGLKIVDRADLVLTDLKLPNMDGLRISGPDPPAERAGSRAHDDGVRQRGDGRRRDESRAPPISC